MSDYGLRVKSAVGNTLLTVTDSITRLMWVSAQTAVAGNSGELSQIDGLSTGNFSISVNSDVTKSTHGVSRSGNVISWTIFNIGTAITPGNCVIFSFAYT